MTDETTTAKTPAQAACEAFYGSFPGAVIAWNDDLGAEHRTGWEAAAEAVAAPLRAQLVAANVRIGELLIELEDLVVERDKARGQVAALTITQAQAAVERDEANARIGELEDERDSTIADFQLLSGTNKMLEGECEQARARIGELEGVITPLLGQRDHLETELAAVTAERDRLARGGRELGRIVERQSRALYAAFIDVRHGKPEDADAILDYAVEGITYDIDWDGTETGAEWLERTRTEAES